MSRLDEFMKDTDNETMVRDITFVNRYIETTKLDTNQISDGKSTFGELYARIRQLEDKNADLEGSIGAMSGMY